MSHNKDQWDNFWLLQDPLDISFVKNDQTWHDLVWQVGFQFWLDVFAKLSPGLSMLECGCGQARVSQYMAQHGYQCTLLDYSEKALDRAKLVFESNSLDANFVIGDINNLPFPDGSFDIVYSGGVLEYFENIENPINEMVRVLKPGGVFAANMVPRKFSVQTLADIEITLAFSFRNLLKGKFTEMFKTVHSVPKNYSVNDLQLHHYIGACKKAQLDPLSALGTSPFPNLALPRIGKRVYAQIMKRLLPLWRQFNLSESKWTEIWGITYTIHGIKNIKEL